MDSFLRVFRIQLFSKVLYMDMSLCCPLKFSICDNIQYVLSNSYTLFYTKFIYILSDLITDETML